MEYNDILKTAIKTFGEENQIIVAIEELSELQKALTKYLRGNSDTKNITEEIADVSIMLGQLILIFRNQKSLVKKMTEKSLRLEHYLRETNNENKPTGKE